MRRSLPKYLASREFVMSVIEDMRTVVATPGYVLDMAFYAYTINNKCHVCAGGSAVVMGMNGDRNWKSWSREQLQVAGWCNCVRETAWGGCVELGHPVPEAAQDAWSPEMLYSSSPGFFAAWERFANALPTLAEIEGVKP